METRKFTQFGTFSIAIMLPIFFFILAMMLTTGLKNAVEALILGFVALTFLICILIFYKITIYVNDTFVSFRLGTGLVGKKYRIENIETCRPVNNPIYYGIGIRKIPNGWLYNVSGLNAIELTFKNSKSVVRIVTKT